MTINVKNGNIVKIIKSDGTSISGKKALQDFFKKDKNLENHLQQRVQNFQKGKGLNNINELCYRYDNGNLVYTNYNGSEWLRYPELTKLDKKGMQSWLEQNENVEKTVNEIIQKGKVNGVSRGSYVYTDAKKNKYYIDKDGNIEKIIIKSKGHDKIYNKGSDDFHSYLYEHKDVKEAIKKEYDAGFAADGTDTNFFEV